MSKLEVTVTSVPVPANDVLGQKAKTLWYLIIGEGDKKTVLNVGQKTYEGVKKLTETKPTK